jgi:hypothetical protein
MSEITVVIPTSPVPCHPSTEIIEAVVASIRRQLPDAPIIIACDGVRPELEHRKQQYIDYRVELLKLTPQWGNVRLLVSMTHRHQAGLLKWVIDDIKTPLLYLNEHDCTLDDKPIDWGWIEGELLSHAGNIVRLYWHEPAPHPEHAYLFGERFGPFIKTVQYSGWPHVARVDFYKKLLADYFSGNDKVMLETVLYSPFVEHTWETFKTLVYVPEPDAIRFHHRNARVDSEGRKDFGDW